MYMRVKQLSNANPAKYRHNVNDQKWWQNAVPIPARPPTTLAPISAGTRPNRSAIHPNKRPPVIAPRKNTDCAMVGRASLSQTHPNCYEKRMEWNFVSRGKRIKNKHLCCYCGVMYLGMIEFISKDARLCRPRWIAFRDVVQQFFGEIHIVHWASAHFPIG